MSEMEKGKKIKTVFVIAIILIMSYSLNGNLEEIQMNEKENSQTLLIEPKQADISDISKVGEFYDGGRAHDLCVIGNLIYIADMDDGLEIINITDPNNPVELGQFNDGGQAYGVYVSGSYAYVADRDDGLEIIDISDPTAPTEVGQFYEEMLYEHPIDVCVSGSYVYLADSFYGLKIIDISDPTNPVKIGYYNPTDHVGASAYNSVYVFEDYAYLTGSSYGLDIFDISDPTNPVKVGNFYDEDGDAVNVYLSKNYIYMANWGGGFKIIDVSNLINPIEIGNFSVDGYVRDIYVSGMYAYITMSDDGLMIVGIVDPTAPVEIGRFDDGGRAYDIYVNGDYVYVADDWDGLEIFYITNDDIEHTISITTPDGSLSWENGSHYISWDYMGYIALVDIELYRDGTFEMIIASDISNQGSYNWTIPIGLDISKNYQIRVIDATDDTVYGISEYFEIYTNSIIITTPDSLSTWKKNSPYYICWNSTGYIYTVNIELYRYDILEMYIASDVSNNGSYCWTIPIDAVNSENYQIKIIDATDSSVYDVSEYFEISLSSIASYDLILLLNTVCIVSIILAFRIRKKDINEK